jgi:epoxide hydrolase
MPVRSLSPDWPEFERGGHFSGLEVPDLLAADIRDFFYKLQVP